MLEPADVVEQLRDWKRVEGLAPGDAKRTVTVKPENLSPESAALWEALACNPASPQELATRLARSPQQISLGLVELELEGVVERDRDGRFYPRTRELD